LGGNKDAALSRPPRLTTEYGLREASTWSGAQVRRQRSAVASLFYVSRRGLSF